MAEILGLGMTHYPPLCRREEEMPSLLRSMLKGTRVPEHAKDPRTWPSAMREEWGNDEGVSAARIHRERCFNAFRVVRERLDRFVKLVPRIPHEEVPLALSGHRKRSGSLEGATRRAIRVLARTDASSNRGCRSTLTSQLGGARRCDVRARQASRDHRLGRESHIQLLQVLRRVFLMRSVPHRMYPSIKTNFEGDCSHGDKRCSRHLAQRRAHGHRRNSCRRELV